MSPERKRGRSKLESISETAQEVLLRDGYHAPTLFVFGNKGSGVVQIMGDVETIRERAAMMQHIGAELGAKKKLGELQQVLLVSEGWASVPEDGKIPEIPPSKDPNRMEILLIALMDLEKVETQILMFEMLRDEKGQLTDLASVEQEMKGTETRAYLLEEFVSGYQGSIRNREENGRQIPR